jgi:hypothetical protein
VTLPKRARRRRSPQRLLSGPVATAVPEAAHDHAQELQQLDLAHLDRTRLVGTSHRTTSFAIRLSIMALALPFN